ncbi:hypothetical protein PUN28_003373 [Cardiocondyla obscurior]|uniref:Uncharacterized protein n=1 Tax=Cardiocondyla obscurior TaxID=286306 RepID=A0AAW2GNQ7_9HYME
MRLYYVFSFNFSSDIFPLVIESQLHFALTRNLVPTSLKEEHTECHGTDTNLLKSPFVELLLPVVDFREKSQSRSTFSGDESESEKSGNLFQFNTRVRGIK